MTTIKEERERLCKPGGVVEVTLQNLGIAIQIIRQQAGMLEIARECLSFIIDNSECDDIDIAVDAARDARKDISDDQPLHPEEK